MDYCKHFQDGFRTAVTNKIYKDAVIQGILNFAASNGNKDVQSEITSVVINSSSTVYPFLTDDE